MLLKLNHAFGTRSDDAFVPCIYNIKWIPIAVDILAATFRCREDACLIDLLRTRRSIRKYARKTIDSKTIDVLIEALLRSPTSRNGKSWEFIIADDRELLSKLSEAKEQGSHHLRDAPLGIVVCADSMKSDVWVEDCSIAAILVQMTAHALGLGSCWIQIRNRNHTEMVSAEQYIQSLLGLPQHIKVECIVSIGYPSEIKGPIADSELEYNKVKYNRYSRTYGPKRGT
jgi:nitroreductase